MEWARRVVGCVWNSEEQRLRAGVRVVIIVGGLMVAYPRLLQAFGLWQRLRDAGVENRLGPYALQYIGQGILAIGAIAGLGLAAWLIDRRPFVDYGFRFDRNWWVDFAAGIGAALLFRGLFVGMGLGLGWYRVAAVGSVEPPFSLISGVLVMVLVFLCVGIAEELIFRAGMLRNLAEGLNTPRVPRWLSMAFIVAGPGFIFGLVHLSNPNGSLGATLGITLGGICGGLIYALRGQLGFVIGMHAAWDFFGTVVVYTPSTVPAAFFPTRLVSLEPVGPTFWTGGAAGSDAGMLQVVALLIVLGAVLVYFRRRYGPLTLDTPLAHYRPRRALPPSRSPATATD